MYSIIDIITHLINLLPLLTVLHRALNAGRFGAMVMFLLNLNHLHKIGYMESLIIFILFDRSRIIYKSWLLHLLYEVSDFFSPPIDLLLFTSLFH